MTFDLTRKSTVPTANPLKGLLGAALAAGLVMLVLEMNGFSVERHEATLFDRPMGHGYHAMIYDSHSRRILLFGGQTGDIFTQPERYLSSYTWAYDPAGKVWQKMSPPESPPALTAHAMAYDSGAEKTVLYGGNSEGSDETWIYDYGTNTWTRRFPETNPGKLSRMPIVYVPEIGGTVLFGGQLGPRQHVYSDETWLYNGDANAWENAAIRLMERKVR